jgi:hypothetical protein
MILDFDPQNCKKINWCHFKPLPSWQCASAALGISVSTKEKIEDILGEVIFPGSREKGAGKSGEGSAP